MTRPTTPSSRPLKRTTTSQRSSIPFPDAECSTVDQACDWLSLERPSLDAVAVRLRSLIVVKRELDQVIELLRHHALAELGEPILRAGAEEPF